ncbi:MAG: WYL domain-containing protein [Coriobacteriia bacterium]|nr:WYL domain-containing protein [Coriobacteriia bacterium]
MTSSPNQKMKLLYISQILSERTNENNAITVNELIRALAAFDIKAERKSIYTDIETLKRFGMDIITNHGRSNAYYLASSLFELPELRMLVDFVESSQFITTDKSEKMIKKLSSLTNIHDGRYFTNKLGSVDSYKSKNSSIMYNVWYIHMAIIDSKKISFKYFDYNLRKERVHRKSSEFYIENPVELCWNDQKYYLICYNTKHDSFVHYRVDKMIDVSVSDEDIDDFADKQINLLDYTMKHFGMYVGDTVRARLRFDRSLINIVIDRYGTSVKILPSSSGLGSPANSPDSDDDSSSECFDVEVEVTDTPVFLSWVFEFGNKAEILAPQSLRESMQHLLGEVSSLYRTD